MKNQNVGNRQRGFTIIELLLVIVISGILAALTLPKFIDLQRDARIASLNSVRGALAATAAMARAKYLVTVPTPTTLTAEGSVITFATVIASGYPRADAGFVGAAGISTTDYTIIAPGTAATANSPVTSATETAIIPVSVAGTTRGLTCFVKYTEATSTTTAPVIAVTSTGC